MNTSCFSLENPVWGFDICVYYETIKSNYLVTSHIYFLWEHWQPPLGIFKHAAQLSGQPESGWCMMELQKQIILAEYPRLLGIVVSFHFPIIFISIWFIPVFTALMNIPSLDSIYLWGCLYWSFYLHLFNFRYNSDL